MKDRIYYIMNSKFDTPIELLNGNYDNDLLTSEKFKYDGNKLTYLFFEIQKSFGVKINPEMVLNYEFNTINGILKIIENLT